MSSLLTWNSLLFLLTEMYSEPCQTSKMKLYAKIVNVNYFHKKLHLRCWTGFWIRLCINLVFSLLTWNTFSILVLLTESYSEPCQTSNMELFAKIGLTIFYSNYLLAENFYLFLQKVPPLMFVWQCSEYASVLI